MRNTIHEGEQNTHPFLLEYMISDRKDMRWELAEWSSLVAPNLLRTVELEHLVRIHGDQNGPHKGL